jgi:CheY-like chemotaxis protein
MPARIHAIMEREGASREEAESRIRRLDHERARWTHFMYGVELGDAGLYDLVVNLEVATIESACEVVLQALRRPEFQIGPAVQARLRIFAEQCRLELEAHHGGKPAAAPATRARVLLVDDEIELATTLAERLRERGYDATAVFSGQEALMSLDESWYDVVLLDLQLAGMDGMTTLRRMRGLHPETQVVMLTGHGTVAQGIEGMQLGVADFLHKPVDIEVLCASVDTAAAKTRENRSQGGQVWR